MIQRVGNKKNFSSFRKTKIVATIGPASGDLETLRKLIKNGMSVARLNFSHGSHDDHLQIINNIRQVTGEEKIHVALLQDLCGPKIRLGKLENPVVLEKGTIITLATDKEKNAELFTDFKELPGLVNVGDTILLDDGYMELKVTAVAQDLVKCRVIVPGTAKAGKGINLPDVKTTITPFTEKDKKDLIFGLQQGVDMIALSFVESGEDIKPLREIMASLGRQLPIIAKIERPAALDNIDGIISAFDGIMIARGDLGVELPPEEVPVLQKKLINLANSRNKLVITATQMLESMILNPRPTRAETSDVANAILDGTDGIMLSGETAVGNYPENAVAMMNRIALITENSQLYQYAIDREKHFSPTEAIVKNAAEMASDLRASCILVFTQTGHTALLLSKYRPPCPVLACTPNRQCATRMASYWGVLPQETPFSTDTDEMIRQGENMVLEKNFVKKGNLVITVAGVNPMRGATNMVRISRIG